MELTIKWAGCIERDRLMEELSEHGVDVGRDDCVGGSITFCDEQESFELLDIVKGLL